MKKISNTIRIGVFRHGNPSDIFSDTQLSSSNVQDQTNHQLRKEQSNPQLQKERSIHRIQKERSIHQPQKEQVSEDCQTMQNAFYT